jgi:threonine dehydratase
MKADVPESTAGTGALPTVAQVEDALAVLREHLPATRLVRASRLSAATGAEVHLKLESDLPTGSFKPRGALYALAARLRTNEITEVVASSTGNHGAAVAFAARVLGVRATIFLPTAPNPVKRERIASLGAQIVEHGPDLAAAAGAARAHAAATDAYYLDDATDPDLPAGPATIGVEIFEQLADARTVIVPIGDTGLIRGVAAVAKRQPHEVRVIGVQAEGAPSYYLSWRAGEPVGTDTCETIADGLATRTPVPASVAAIREVVDEVVLVSDSQMLAAVRLLLLEEHVVAEPSGAAATAALLALDVVDSPVVALVTGANLSPAMLERVAAAGKLHREKE